MTRSWGVSSRPDTVLDGLNRYAYCGNNPVMYTDPSGHFWWIPLLIYGIVAIIKTVESAGTWEFWEWTWDDIWYGITLGTEILEINWSTNDGLGVSIGDGTVSTDSYHEAKEREESEQRFYDSMAEFDRQLENIKDEYWNFQLTKAFLQYANIEQYFPEEGKTRKSLCVDTMVDVLNHFDFPTWGIGDIKGNPNSTGLVLDNLLAITGTNIPNPWITRVHSAEEAGRMASLSTGDYIVIGIISTGRNKPPTPNHIYAILGPNIKTGRGLQAAGGNSKTNKIISDEGYHANGSKWYSHVYYFKINRFY